MSDDPSEVLDAIGTHFADRLSDWEASFVDSLSRQLDSGRSLTPKQLSKLDEVFERVSHGGRG